MDGSFASFALAPDGDLLLEIGHFPEHKPGESDQWYHGAATKAIHCGFCVKYPGQNTIHRPPNYPAVRIRLSSQMLESTCPAIAGTVKESKSPDVTFNAQQIRKVHLDDDPWMFVLLCNILFIPQSAQPPAYCYEVLLSIAQLAIKYNLRSATLPWFRRQQKDYILTDPVALETGPDAGDVRRCLEVMKISHMLDDALPFYHASRHLLYAATPNELEKDIPKFFGTQRLSKKLLGRFSDQDLFPHKKQTDDSIKEALSTQQKKLHDRLTSYVPQSINVITADKAICAGQHQLLKIINAQLGFTRLEENFQLTYMDKSTYSLTNIVHGLRDISEMDFEEEDFRCDEEGCLSCKAWESILSAFSKMELGQFVDDCMVEVGKTGLCLRCVKSGRASVEGGDGKSGAGCVVHGSNERGSALSQEQEA